MNLSDTSRESSVNSSRFEEVENDIEHQTLNLSVTSSIQSSTNTDGLNVQDLVAENRRLTQENDDLKRRFMKEVSEKLPFSTSQLQELSQKIQFWTKPQEVVSKHQHCEDFSTLSVEEEENLKNVCYI